MGDSVVQTWQDKVRLKQEAREKEVAAFENETVSDDVLASTDIDDIELLAKRIASGELTSETVTKAYIQKAIKAHRLTNCLTEVIFTSALQQARSLDAYQSQHDGQTVGPLHGIPMTLKDQFNIAGRDTTLGYVGRVFQPAEEDAVLVQMLKSLGAVILAKTNLPQTIMWCETDNPLWGLTMNPMNKDYTPGGSTGGESALLYMHGSLMGWGTDLGGSVRIPASMMGLYGLRPSYARLPYWGVPVSTEGQEHVPSSIGPLGRHLTSVTSVMRSLIQQKPWEMDAKCAPIPWRENVYQEYLAKKPLTIGLLLDDGVVRPHPPLTRVLKGVVEKLKKAGHDVVEWNAHWHAECIQVMDEYYTCDGCEDIRHAISSGGESPIPHVASLISRGNPISVYEYWQLNRRKIALQQAYLEKWNSIKSPVTGRTVDVLLMPPMPHLAVPHRHCRWVGYTKIWNVLDYSAMVMPAGRAGPEDDVEEWAGYEVRNEMDRFNAEVWTKYGAEMRETGLPVSIQIVGRKLEEEKVLAVSAALEQLIREE